MLHEAQIAYYAFDVITASYTLSVAQLRGLVAQYNLSIAQLRGRVARCMCWRHRFLLHDLDGYVSGQA